MRILCVDDEEAIGQIVQMALERNGYQVELAFTGTEALERSLEGDWSLIILDLMLPGLDGLEVCRRMRLRRDRTPVLMLTARGELCDEIHGLEVGADDYLAKPFAVERLVARVKALLRRDAVQKTGRVSLRDLEIDLSHRLLFRGGISITLSRKEWDIFQALVENEGRPLSRESLLMRVWNDQAAVGSNIVDVYINMLRRKLDDGADHKLIRTIYGVGYALERPT
ncbi:MAG: response regulator transcription factor [Armatimonas sp.]